MRPSGYVLVASAACAVFWPGQVPREPARLIVGTWHGTSICADPQTDRACRDEEVIYEVDSAAGPRGPVRCRADKVVAGVRENMGTLHLTYDSTTQSWSADLAARIQARWTFQPQGETMAGVLRELPSNRLVRRVTVRRTRTG